MNSHCPDCRGTGFKKGKPRRLDRGDGKFIEYETVMRCLCDRTAAGKVTSPLQQVDRKSQSAGDNE